MPKAKIDKVLLLKVAENARLNLSEKEVQKFLPQLKDVLDFFSKLDKLDVSREQPSFQPIPLKNVFREDKAEKCLSVEEALGKRKHLGFRAHAQNS